MRVSDLIIVLSGPPFFRFVAEAGHFSLWAAQGNFNPPICFRQFAVSLGYAMDRRESWRGSTVLRRDADKIVVKRNHNGHYVFFSVRDDRDNGTIIDFLQRRL
jgi:hypothetical protein